MESVESDCWFHVAKKIWGECRVPVEARMMGDVVVGGVGGRLLIVYHIYGCC